MGADADKKKGYTLYGLRITPATVVGSISFLTVTALLLQERSYRRRIEHEDAVDRGICEAQAYRPQLEGAAELFPVKEVPHGHDRGECNGIVFVQSDTRELLLDFKETDFRNVSTWSPFSRLTCTSHAAEAVNILEGRERVYEARSEQRTRPLAQAQLVAPGNVPGDVRTLAAMSNRGYAMEHGYCHVWAQCYANERHPSWCKLKAVEYALDRWKESDVVYLDSDAYIRTHRPIDMSQLRESGAQAAFTLGCEWFPFVHQAMGLDLRTMPAHTSVFHEGTYLQPDRQNGTFARGDEPWPTPEAIVPSVFVVMKAWDHDQEETQALKFVRQWWDSCTKREGKKADSMTVTLNDLAATNDTIRQSIALLDYPAYNGADGMFIRHLSSERGGEAAFKHDLADTLIRHADKTTLYFTELFGDIYKAYISV